MAWEVPDTFAMHSGLSDTNFYQTGPETDRETAAWIFFEYIPLILTGLVMLLHSESPAIQAHVQHSIVTVSVKGKHARESYWPWVQFSFVLPFLSLPAQVGSAPLPSSSVHTPASAAATPVKPMLVGQLQRLDQWESLLQTERQLGTQMVASRRGQKNSNKLQIG